MAEPQKTFLQRGRPIIDLTGQRFGRLIVCCRVGGSVSGSAIWRCRCDCGRERKIVSGSLRSGVSQSCGCLQRETARARAADAIKHGAARRNARTPEYSAWSDMLRRCSPQAKGKLATYYYARGIRVCDRWSESFEAFLADMGPRPPRLTLERINNDGDYEPANCCWATRFDQIHNRRPRSEWRNARHG
jgi:hypothetical protein